MAKRRIWHEENLLSVTKSDSLFSLEYLREVYQPLFF